MPEETHVQNTVAALSKAYSDFNALRIRLDTQPLLEQIEYFLKGKRETVHQDKEGKILTSAIITGVPKANDEGIQSLLNWMSATINTQTVQGNFPADSNGNSIKYDAYIFEYHVELSTLIVLNAYNWEIDDDEIDGIIEFVMLLVIPFMSRLIGNKERESYGETMKTIESSILRAKGNLSPLSNPQ